MAFELVTTGSATGLISIGNSSLITATQLPSSNWSIVTKTADETISSDATISPDSQLAFPIPNGTSYRFRGRILVDSTATADWQFQIAFNSGAVSNYRVQFIFQGGANFLGVISSAAAQPCASGIHNSLGFEGIVTNGTGADTTVEFRWAQNTSDAANTTVFAGSYIEYAAL